MILTDLGPLLEHKSIMQSFRINYILVIFNKKALTITLDLERFLAIKYANFFEEIIFWPLPKKLGL